jgi:hypothetical protein
LYRDEAIGAETPPEIGISPIGPGGCKAPNALNAQFQDEPIQGRFAAGGARYESCRDGGVDLGDEPPRSVVGGM